MLQQPSYADNINTKKLFSINFDAQLNSTAVIYYNEDRVKLVNYVYNPPLISLLNGFFINTLSDIFPPSCLNILTFVFQFSMASSQSAETLNTCANLY